MARRILGCALVFVLLWAGLGRAQADESELWHFKKGEAVAEVDVSAMPPYVRQALRAQMEQQGWVLQGPAAVAPRPAPDAEVEPKDADPKGADPKGAQPKPSGTRLDIEELVRRGGQLPEGFRPHDMGKEESPEGPALPPFLVPGGRAAGGKDVQALVPLVQATGRLILKALDARSDPVKGPVYERLLKELGTTLSKLDDPEAAMAQLPMKWMLLLQRGMSDPESAAVYCEVLGDLMQSLGGLGAGVGRLPGRSDAPKPTESSKGQDSVLEFLGARLQARPAGVGEVPRWPFVAVPPQSLAAQIGVEVGDMLLALDGEPVSHRIRAQASASISGRGQLSLTLLRRDGSTDVLDVAFE